MQFYLLLFTALLPAWMAAQRSIPLQVIAFPSAKFTLHCTPQDSALSSELVLVIEKSIDSIELFFRHPFPNKFEVFVFADRAALNRQWQQEWGDTSFQSACWMVASGVAHRLDVLSPNAWDTEACEHKATDTMALRRLLCHELVHVFHGQHNPNPDFNGMDEMAWWVEGLAVYAAGQLDPIRLNGVIEQLKNGNAPDSLQNFWRGKHKYGLTGTLALWLDVRYGRTTIFQLLSTKETNQALSMLGINEQTLLENWRLYWLRNH